MNRALRLGALLAGIVFSAQGNLPAPPEEYRSLAVPVTIRHAGLERGLFPLTLTLSPGEREQQGVPFELSQRVQFASRLPALLPLPQGEGRGEGERDARSSHRVRLCRRSRAAATASSPLVQQDVFVAGQGGYHTYRIPALIVASNQTVLAFCEGRKRSASDTGDIDLLLRRSTDGGRTWSEQQVVWDDGPNTCGNPCPVVDETTRIIWLLLTHNPGNTGERQIRERKPGAMRTVWLSRSEDNGKTWTAPVDITASTKDPSWRWYATGPGVGIQLRHGPNRGRLVIPCDHSFPGADRAGGGPADEGGSHIIYSDDHGQTWKLGGTVRPQMNESQVIELSDGEGGLLINMRTSSKSNRRAQAISRDGGQTWTAPEYSPELVEPRCQASIFRFNWPSGQEPGRILFSNPASTRRNNLTVRVSRDDGKTWPASRTLHEGPCAYSCLTVLTDKAIGCLYECGRTNAYEKISFARFPLSWLEETK